MNRHTQRYSFSKLVVVFLGLPLFFYATGDFPRRNLLKESASIITILAFSLMLAQFFLTRANHSISRGYSIGGVIKIHKILGYAFLGILLIHPFLIVVPRFFESGIDPLEAFITIITTFNSLGIVLGICAWGLLFIIGVTSLLRKKLPISFKTWRLIHGVLAALFVVLASWHAIDLGRHTTLLLSSYFIAAGMSGVLPHLKNTYHTYGWNKE